MGSGGKRFRIPFWRYWVRVSAGTPTITTQVPCYCLQSRETNAGIVPFIFQDRLLLNRFQFSILPRIQGFIRHRQRRKHGYFLNFALSLLACLPIRINLNYGPYRLLLGLLGRGISPDARPLPTRNNTNTEETHAQISTP